MNASGLGNGQHVIGHSLFMGLGSAILVYGVVVTLVRRPPNGTSNLLCGSALWLLMLARYLAFVIDSDLLAVIVLVSAEMVLAAGILVYNPAAGKGDPPGVPLASGSRRAFSAVIRTSALVFLLVAAVAALYAFGAPGRQGLAPYVLAPALGAVPIALAFLVQVMRGLHREVLK